MALNPFARWRAGTDGPGGAGESRYRKALGLREAGRWEDCVLALRDASDAGHAGAAYELGRMSRDGDYLPRNREQAIRWFRLAAQRGHVHAGAAWQALSVEGREQRGDRDTSAPSIPAIESGPRSMQVCLFAFHLLPAWHRQRLAAGLAGTASGVVQGELQGLWARAGAAAGCADDGDSAPIGALALLQGGLCLRLAPPTDAPAPTPLLAWCRPTAPAHVALLETRGPLHRMQDGRVVLASIDADQIHTVHGLVDPASDDDALQAVFAALSTPAVLRPGLVDPLNGVARLEHLSAYAGVHARWSQAHGAVR